MEIKNHGILMSHYSLMSAAALSGFKHVTISLHEHSVETCIYYDSLKLQESPEKIVYQYAADGDTIISDTLDVEGREVYTYILRSNFED